MAERIKLGGLWLNKTRDGKEYLSGNINGNVKILIFKNDYRSEDKHPTHVMYLAPVEKQDDQQQRPAAPADGFFSAGGALSAAGNGSDEGDFDGGDDFEDAEPAPAPPARRPAAAPARPNGASAGAARPAAPPQRPASPGRRGPAPAAGAGDDFEDLDDPFAN